MNKLAIDIGNTHIVLGVFFNSDMRYSWRIGTDKRKTEDEYFGILRGLFSAAGIQENSIDCSALSSVVPDLTRVFLHLLQKYFTNTKLIVVNAYSKLGLTFPMDDPGFVGADLVVNAFAAKEKYKANCIICDFGSATTIQLIGKDGYFYGTAICPGVLTSSKNLFETASQLSNIQLNTPENILGITTQDALKSGIINGNAFMIDKFILGIRSSYKKLGDIKAIATGGISGLICESSEEIDVVDKNLTLEGLNMICSRK